ncbi:MAG: hypothetical protein ABFS45_20525 [Pseudomonadota bacterium]
MGTLLLMATVAAFDPGTIPIDHWLPTCDIPPVEPGHCYHDVVLETIVCIDPGEYEFRRNDLLTNEFHPELDEVFEF